MPRPASQRSWPASEYPDTMKSRQASAGLDVDLGAGAPAVARALHRLARAQQALRGMHAQ
jgi:hypothetical protein